jgi:hypothetical protein
MSRTRSSLALLVGCVCALGLGGTAALAAEIELPTKAPPAPPPPPSNWTAFITTNYEFGQVNPQGQAVYKEGDINVVAGADLSLYNNKSGFINGWTIGGLGIVDFASGSTLGPSDSFWANFNNNDPGGATSPLQGGTSLYYILSANTSITFAQYWKLTESFYHLVGTNANGSITNPGNTMPGLIQPANCTWTHFAPGAQFGCLDLPAWYWNELKLSLDDGAITHWAISFNPYITWYAELYPSGYTGVLGTTTSAACFSCNASVSDFIIGMTPTLSLLPYWHVPVTLTVPTWVTVGPKSFWAGTAGAGSPFGAGVPGSGCVPLASLPANNCSNGNIGVFTTGLTATWALAQVPAQYGHWFVKGGFQWYDIVNTALQADNTVTYGCNGPGPSTVPNCTLKQSILTAFVGLGVGF